MAATNGQSDPLIPACFPLGPRWYAVFTNIRCESRAQLGLDAKGFRTFLPKTRKWVTHARVKRAVELPLLSRYLFVEIDPNRQSFEAVRATHGVEQLLANAGSIGSPTEDRIPSAIPDGLVADMIRRQMQGEFDLTRRQPLPIGARVRIMDGEYADMLATIVALGSRRGGEVFAQLLGERTRSRFALISVRPA